MDKLVEILFQFGQDQGLEVVHMKDDDFPFFPLLFTDGSIFFTPRWFQKFWRASPKIVGFMYFLWIFTPDPWGNDSIWLDFSHIFQMSGSTTN